MVKQGARQANRSAATVERGAPTVKRRAPMKKYGAPMTTHGVPMANRKAGRFGYGDIVERIATIRHEVGDAPLPDRRAVLQRLCLSFAVEEAVLLRRGFDKAYRQIVEGV